MSTLPTYTGPSYTGYGTSGTGGPVNGAYDPNQAMANYQKIMGNHLVTSQGGAYTYKAPTNYTPYTMALGSALHAYGLKNAGNALVQGGDYVRGIYNNIFAPDQSAAETARLGAQDASLAPAQDAATPAESALATDTAPDAYAALDGTASGIGAAAGAGGAADMAALDAGTGSAAMYAGGDMAINAATDYAAADAAAAAAADAAAYDAIGSVAELAIA